MSFSYFHNNLRRKKRLLRIPRHDRRGADDAVVHRVAALEHFRDDRRSRGRRQGRKRLHGRRIERVAGLRRERGDVIRRERRVELRVQRVVGRRVRGACCRASASESATPKNDAATFCAPNRFASATSRAAVRRAASASASAVLTTAVRRRSARRSRAPAINMPMPNPTQAAPVATLASLASMRSRRHCARAASTGSQAIAKYHLRIAARRRGPVRVVQWLHGSSACSQLAGMQVFQADEC